MREIKSDRRSRYTRMVLRDALIDLLEEKPLNKITVSSICELAEVNRGTFYLHFLDVYDLFEQTEQEFLLDIIDNVENMVKAKNPGYGLVELFNLLRNNVKLCRMLIGANGDEKFFGRVLDEARSACLKAWRKTNTDEKYLNRAFSFVSSGCVGIIKDWIQSGLTESAEEMAEFLSRMSIKCFG